MWLGCNIKVNSFLDITGISPPFVPLSFTSWNSVFPSSSCSLSSSLLSVPNTSASKRNRFATSSTGLVLFSHSVLSLARSMPAPNVRAACCSGSAPPADREKRTEQNGAARANLLLSSRLERWSGVTSFRTVEARGEELFRLPVFGCLTETIPYIILLSIALLQRSCVLCHINSLLASVCVNIQCNVDQIVVCKMSHWAMVCHSLWDLYSQML